IFDRTNCGGAGRKNRLAPGSSCRGAGYGGERFRKNSAGVSLEDHCRDRREVLSARRHGTVTRPPSKRRDRCSGTGGSPGRTSLVLLLAKIVAVCVLAVFKDKVQPCFADGQGRQKRTSTLLDLN